MPTSPERHAQTEDEQASPADAAVSYAGIQGTSEPVHRELLKRMEKHGVREVLKRLKNGEISPQILEDHSRNISAGTSELDRYRIPVDAPDRSFIVAGVEELKKDLRLLVENLENIRSFGEMLQSGDTKGYSAALMEDAVSASRDDVERLLNRLQSAHFSGPLGRLWARIDARLTRDLVTLGMSLGVMFAAADSLNLREDDLLRVPSLDKLTKEMASKPGQQRSSAFIERGDKTSLHLGNKKEADEPNVENSGEKPGVLEEGKPFASIEGEFPEFFATRVYQIDDRSRRVFVPEKSFSQRVSTQGRIRIHEGMYAKGTVMHLPVPLGFLATDVVSIPTTPIEVAGNTVTFTADTKDPTRIAFKAGRTAQNLYPLTVSSEFKLPDTPELAALKTAAGRGSRNLEPAIKEYLRNFTYIVSSDFQKLLDILPSSLPEKTALLRMGDCDVLADHLAFALKHKVASGVAQGFWNAKKEPVLKTGQAHARFVWTGVNNSLQQMETTDYVKRTFINVQFLPEDYSMLEDTAKKIGFAQDQKEQERLIREFGELIENMLQKPEYTASKPSGEFARALQKLIEQNAESLGRLHESFSKEYGDIYEISLASAALLAAVGALAGMGFLAAVLAEKHKRKVRREDVAQDISFLEETNIMDPSRGSAGSKQIDREFDWLAERLGLDEQNSANLSGEQKILLLLLDALREERGKGYKLFNFPLIPYTLSQGRFDTQRLHRTIKELAEAGAVTPEGIKNSIVEIFSSEKFKEQAVEQKERVVNLIFRRAKGITADIDRAGQEPVLNRLFDVPGSFDQRGRIGKKIAQEEFYQLREYQKSDDPRIIDWKATGRRDKPMVRESRNVEGGRRKSTFYVVVDLPSVGNYAIERLAGLLILASKNKNIHISGMDFYAFGSPIKRMEETTMQKLLHEPSRGFENVRKMIELLVEGRIDTSVITTELLNETQTNSDSGRMLPPDLPEKLRGKGAIIALGFYPPPELKQGNRFVHFREGKHEYTL